MLPQFNHDMMTSVALWLDNKLTSQGQAYVNVTGSMYLQADSSINGKTYVSPYRGWVYDSCVAGATIPTSVMTSAGQVLTRASGIVFDWQAGSVISPINLGPSISGAYARKEVNVYYSNPTETDYLLEQVYGENKDIAYSTTGFKGQNRTLAAPLIMLTNSLSHNAPFAIGGIDETRSTVNAFIITNDAYLQEGVTSICRDSADQTIPFCSIGDFPITASGDLKGGTFNYCTGIYDRIGCFNGLFIQDVYEIKLNERANRNTTFLMSVLQFDLRKIRL